MARLGAVLLASAVAGCTAAAALSGDDPPAATVTVTTATTVAVTSRYRGRTATSWARRYRHRTRQLQAAHARTTALRRELLHAPETVEAINLACAVYGHCTTLWRKATCESTLSPVAHNPSGASGLFQFIPSTFRSTPFGGFSIWSPYANAMAAGWMHATGRGSEWECR